MHTKLFLLFILTLLLSGCTMLSQPAVVPTQSEQVETSTGAPVENAGTYALYNEANVSAAQDRGDRVVLFFHAGWCPTCQAADQELINKRVDIPAGLTILKTDYDTEKALKEKYSITYQHTFVQIDQAGNELNKWNGGGLDQIRSKIK